MEKGIKMTDIRVYKELCDLPDELEKWGKKALIQIESPEKAHEAAKVLREKMDRLWKECPAQDNEEKVRYVLKQLGKAETVAEELKETYKIKSNPKTDKKIGIICLGIMILGMFYSENIAREVENGLYRDKVVLSKQTKYQNIVMTKHKDDVRLFINGNIQFSSMDEYRYHEALVHIPMSVAEKKQKILILGGGDGLALREVLKYSQVEQVTMVDLDGEMIDLCKSNQDINK